MNREECMHALENELTAQVDRDKLMDYTANISQWVRISSLPAEVESLKYVEKTLQSFGYKTQMLHYDGFISYPIEARVTVHGSQEEIVFKSLGHCFSDSTPDGGITAPACFDADNCAGKIAFIDGLPNYGKVMHAKANGALAVIFVQDDYLHNMPVNPIWGSPTQDTVHLLAHIPVAAVTHPDGEKLRAMCENGEVAVTLESKVEMGWKRDLPILVADLPSEKSDKFVLLSCHIDSWDYGAMDNGTANATAIECARVLAQKRGELYRGLRVCFWSGHSQGKFCGSSWYADTHYEELERRCIAHVNIDSTGGKGAVVVEEPPVMPHTRKLAADVIKEQTGVDFIGKRIGHFADQSFFGVGLSSVFGTFSEQSRETAGDSLSFKHGTTVRASGLGWWWHTEYDTIDKIDPDFLVRDTKIYAAVLWRLMTAPVLPLEFSDAVKDLAGETEKLQKLLGDRFDFSPLAQRLKKLGAAVDRFDGCLAAIDAPESSEAVRANEVMQRVAQCFVRASFTAGNVYTYSLGTPMKDIPSLTDAYALAEAEDGSDEYFMLKTSLRRGLNRVMACAGRALELLEEYFTIA